MFLLSTQTDHGIIENPYLLAIIWFIIIVPGFFFGGYVLAKIITFNMAGHEEAKAIGIACAIIGALFALTLGYMAITTM